jgi:hypothetical protein
MVPTLRILPDIHPRIMRIIHTIMAVYLSAKQIPKTSQNNKKRAWLQAY